MKSLNTILGLGALALITLQTSAFAKDGQTYMTFPKSVQCQACGAEHRLRPETAKDGSINLKAELIAKAANPKSH